MERRDRRLDLVRPDRRRERLVERARASSIASWSQRERSWSSSSTRSPLAACALAPRVLEQHQREQAADLRLVGQQPAEEPREPDRFLAQVRRSERASVAAYPR